MPPHMPSSFAAAAGQGSSRDSRNGRGDGRSGDWARRENRPNGTVTLRRTSTATFAQSSSAAEEASSLPTANTETSGVAQSSNSNYDQPTDYRLSKDNLLQIYKDQLESGAFSGDVSDLFEEGWNPGQPSATNGRSGWGKVNDNRDNHGPDVCWDARGNVRPISLEAMTEEEKTLFAGDVNSPIKLPPQNSNKDTGMGANGRKISVSQAQGSGAYGGLSSPASSRPGTRRQQTADSISGMASPSGTGRFARDEPSPFFTRKFPDSKDGADDRVDEPKSSLPYSLMRSNTAGSALGNGPPSPWGLSTANASMSPMGNFGNFSAATSSVNPPTPIEKRPLFGRAESRLAHLMPKESTEDLATKAADRPWRPRQRTDTDPFSDEAPSGSSALHDTSPLMSSQKRVQGLDTPVRGSSGDFGMSDMAGFRETNQRSQVQQTPQGRHDDRDQMSPSDTNPYRSPPNDRNDADEGSYDDEPQLHNRMQGLGGIPEHTGSNAFNTLGRNFPHQTAAFDGSDRSQTSSVGASKGFPSVGGLSSIGGMNGLSGWPTSSNATGTPDRDVRSGFPGVFGSSIFGPMPNDLASPSIGNLGNAFNGGMTSTAPNAGRGSKLGSLFPPAMQAQMHTAENDGHTEGGDIRANAFGAIGRNTTAPSRDTDSPLRSGRHAFEDLFPATDSSRAQGFSASGSMANLTSTVMPGYQQQQGSANSLSNQMPASQQRQMVMPDRMLWVYLDPQGEVQGPWSGLEMHEWYKAAFFTADLSVKKVEDADFEPLGQLIRRIGNSREPFLVPQIGIPHGQAAPQAGAPFTPAVAGQNAGAQPGAVQPPFAGAFPSFGTTLTAEQQNNLERRKQEEQFLMARQREYLAQQQVNMKQMQMGGHPAALHHNSSAHSLQSHSSFSNMASPIGMPPQAPLPGAGFFDSQARPMPQQPGAMSFETFRDEELARLGIQDRQQLFNTTIGAPQQPLHAQQMGSMFGQQLDARQPRMEQNDPQGHLERLREFNNYQEQNALEESLQTLEANANTPIGPPQQTFQPQRQPTPPQQFRQEPEPQPEAVEEPKAQAPEILSLTQQVQKAASAKQSPVVAPQPESPWGKVHPGLPMPFPPPPQSTTPLPAPTAQRGRSNLPETLNVEAESRSETPELTSSTPSLAPWAKETVETTKGPSLKEIQEAESKKAAKAEEIAAASRRANLEQEMKMLSLQQTAPAPGLPTSSTWGSTASPALPTNTTSVWAKPAVLKAQPSSTAPSKKTLADIQREEESRKQKLAAAAAAAQPPTGVVGGKRYADLASKVTPTPAMVGNSAWSTVGAGGKIRIPTGPAAAAPQAMRSVSSAAVATVSSARVVRPVAAVRSNTTQGPNSVAVAKEEFNKWAKATLSRGLNPGINLDSLVNQMNSFPLESELIRDSTYAANSVLNGEDFAAEWVRRRIAAEKGVFEPVSISGASESGGWSEVAKKGPPKEETPASGFKVVPAKKKGKK